MNEVNQDWLEATLCLLYYFSGVKEERCGEEILKTYTERYNSIVRLHDT